MADAVFEETIRLVTNIPDEARRGEAAIHDLDGALSRLKSLQFVQLTDLQKIVSAENAVTAQLRTQADLEAKIATFDAQRFAKAEQLRRELAKMQAGALKGAGLGGEEAAPSGIDSMFARFASASALIAGVKKMAEIDLQIVETIGKIGLATSRFAIEAADFRAGTEHAFQQMVGSAKIADQLYDRVIDIAVRTGQSKERVAEESRRLLASGFKADEVPKLLQAFADLERVKGEGSSQRIEKLLEKTQASGKFDKQAISALAKQGISTNDVYAALEKRLGKTRAEVERLAKAGKIDAATGIAATTDALEKRFGGAARPEGVFGLFQAIQTRAAGLFDKVDTGPIQEAEKSLLGALSGESGAGLKGAITTLFGDLFHALFDPFKGPEGQKKLENVINAITAGVRKLDGVIRAAAPWIKKAVDLISDLTSGHNAKGDGESGLSKFLETLQLLGDVARMASFDQIKKDLDSLFDIQIPELPDLSSLGSDMIAGLVDGIESGAASVVNAMTSVVTGAVAEAKAVLGIASPSKVFEGLGAFSAQGFAGGLEGGASGVAAASAGLGATAARAAYAPPAAARPGGGGFGPMSFQMAVHVPPGTTEGEKIGEAAFREFERNFRRLSRDLAESGGVTS